MTRRTELGLARTRFRSGFFFFFMEYQRRKFFEGRPFRFKVRQIDLDEVKCKSFTYQCGGEVLQVDGERSLDGAAAGRDASGLQHAADAAQRVVRRPLHLVHVRVRGPAQDYRRRRARAWPANGCCFGQITGTDRCE